MALTPSEREKARPMELVRADHRQQGTINRSRIEGSMCTRVPWQTDARAGEHARHNKARAERSAIIADESKRRPRTRFDFVGYRGLFAR